MPTKQTVVSIDTMPRKMPRKQGGKAVASNQKAIDELPLNSGTWRVKGIPGLYIRCRVKTKSYFLQRRVRGGLSKHTIGEVSLKQAREQAMERWSGMEPKPPAGRKTFGQAFRDFLEDGGKHGQLSEKTRTLYTYNLHRYLVEWRDRALEDIGKDEECGRVLYRQLKKQYGPATASQAVRLANAVWRHARRVNRKLPEPPTAAVALPLAKSRDWALDPDELRGWWKRTQTNNSGKEITLGVSTLSPVKRMWWLTCLFTGARRGSVEALRWSDVDLDKKVVHFRVAKGGRVYSQPLSDKLAEIMMKYRDSGHVPPTAFGWLFPSPSKDDGHVVNVRDDKKGIASAHHARHTMKTTLTQLGATTEQSLLLMGHSMGSDVSRGYITTTAPALVESLRAIINKVAAHYIGILGDLT